MDSGIYNANEATTQPYREAGNEALQQQELMLGIKQTGTQGTWTPQVSANGTVTYINSSTGETSSTMPTDSTPTQGVGTSTPYVFNTTDPSYAFNLSQGEQALDRRAAASGQFQSGGALKDAMTYASGLASNEFSNQFARLGTISGEGASVTTTTNNTNTASETALNNSYTQQGTAQQNADLNNGKIYSNLLSSLASAAGGASGSGSSGSLSGLGSLFAPSNVQGSNPNGYNGTQNNPSAYVPS